MDRKTLFSLWAQLTPASIMMEDRESYTEETRLVPAPPTEAKPPGLNPRYPRGARLPRLAVAEVADGQEAWIQAAHSDTVSLRARALGAASSQETSPGRTPPGEEVVYFSVLQVYFIVSVL